MLNRLNTKIKAREIVYMSRREKGKQSNLNICGTLVMSVVLIAAASSTLFLNAEAESPDWDVNDDGNCNLLDINQQFPF